MDVPGGGDENDKDKGKEGEGERTRQFYDVGEWENLQKKERGLGLGKTEVKETRVLISDGREVGLFQIPKFRSLPSNLMGDLNLQYFAQRFEKMIADRFGITKNQQFWLESMEDGSITDLGQPWGLKNGGKYWLVLGETKGVYCPIYTATVIQKKKKTLCGWKTTTEPAPITTPTPLPTPPTPSKKYQNVEYSLGFVSFLYWYDGFYMMEGGVEVRWTSQEALEKGCFVRLEWEREEGGGGSLENYWPGEEEKSSVVSHSDSRAYSMTGGIQATAGGPTGGVEMGMTRGKSRTIITQEDSYHTQVRYLTPTSIEWVLEFNKKSETKKYATHLRKLFKIFLKIDEKIEHGEWTPALKVTIGYDTDRKLPQIFRGRIFRNIIAICPSKIHEWEDDIFKIIFDSKILQLYLRKGGKEGNGKGKEVVFTEALEVGMVLQWVKEKENREKSIEMTEDTFDNINRFFGVGNTFSPSSPSFSPETSLPSLPHSSHYPLLHSHSQSSSLLLSPTHSSEVQHHSFSQLFSSPKHHSPPP